MHHTRRNFPSMFALILLLAAMVWAVLAVPGFAAPQTQNQSTAANPFSPMPNGPAAANNPMWPRPLPSPSLAESNPGPMLEQNQNQMKKDIQQLYTMVQQLKEQSDKTNSTQVLSLGLIHKTKKIENLAKKIEKLAAGS